MVGARRGAISCGRRSRPWRSTRRRASVTPWPWSTAVGVSASPSSWPTPRRVTAALLATGLAPGERAAVWSPNRYEWLVAALGILGAGGAVVPVNTRFKGEEVRYILDRSGARVVFTVGEFLDADYAATIAGLRSELPNVVTVVGFDDATAADQSLTEFQASGDAIDDATIDACIGARRWRRRERRALHVGHDRRAEGRAHDARADVAAVLRLVRHGGAGRRRPLPDREPVLPHVRVQGGLSRVADARCDHHPEGGVRRRRPAAHASPRSR